jgi:hypothetical protein
MFDQLMKVPNNDEMKELLMKIIPFACDVYKNHTPGQSAGVDLEGLLGESLIRSAASAKLARRSLRMMWSISKDAAW